MRFIDVTTLRLREVNEKEYSEYAILSHTWGKEEVINGTASQMTGYAKIQGTCAMAKRTGLRYVWIDTCCTIQSHHQ